MPELPVEFTDDELRDLNAAAAAAGVPLTRYVHDVALRARQRQVFVASAGSVFDRHVAEFDAAFPEDAPSAAHAA